MPTTPSTTPTTYVSSSGTTVTVSCSVALDTATLDKVVLIAQSQFTQAGCFADIADGKTGVTYKQKYVYVRRGFDVTVCEVDRIVINMNEAGYPAQSGSPPLPL